MDLEQLQRLLTIAQHAAGKLKASRTGAHGAAFHRSEFDDLIRCLDDFEDAHRLLDLIDDLECSHCGALVSIPTIEPEPEPLPPMYDHPRPWVDQPSFVYDSTQGFAQKASAEFHAAQTREEPCD